MDKIYGIRKLRDRSSKAAPKFMQEFAGKMAGLFYVAGQDRGIAFFQAIGYMLEGIYFFLMIEVVDGIFFELAQLLVVRFQGGFVEGGIKMF